MQPSIIDLTTKLSATTLSINNVSDALGLSGDGAFSLQVITKFTDLQADNETLRAMVHELTAQRDSMAPGDTKAAKMGNEKITPLTIKRDENGYWTHPGYQAYFQNKEVVSDDDVATFCDKFGVEFDHSFMLDELEGICEQGFDEACYASRWAPKPPDGDGWFIASIHDTEGGPVCIWMREAK